MDFDYILIIFGFIGLIYYYGFKNGILFFIFLALIGGIAGVVQSGFFFGKIGEYILLLFLLIYGVFLHFKCGKELSKSLEGQGICIKREWKKLITYIKGKKLHPRG